MPISARRPLLLIGFACFLFAVAGWTFYGLLFSFAPAQDFMVFYTAARACLDGHLPLIFDGDAFTAQINSRFGGWFSRPLDFHPWVYPPLFLLVVTPIGILPFSIAFTLFLIVSFVSLNCAVRCFIPPGYQRWLCAASLILSPATAFTIAVGQNSFMMTALLVGGFGLITRAPVVSGILLGILICKPQLWLLVPVALLAARRWKVFAITIATAGFLVAISLIVFGIDAWLEWLKLMFGASPQYRHWLQFGRLNGQSAYTDAVLLGAPETVASAVQVLVTTLCAALVAWCFRLSGLRRDLQLAVLLTATVLAAPHSSNYDAVMVTVAVTIYLCRVIEKGFRFGDALLVIVVWSIELLNTPQMVRVGLVTPLVLCVFLAAVILRGRSGVSTMTAKSLSHRPLGLLPACPARATHGTDTRIEL
jgi:alpha-1,2-mannosyltransferase